MMNITLLKIQKELHSHSVGQMEWNANLFLKFARELNIINPYLRSFILKELMINLYNMYSSSHHIYLEKCHYAIPYFSFNSPTNLMYSASVSSDFSPKTYAFNLITKLGVSL